jgi:hypothetical protein
MTQVQEATVTRATTEISTAMATERFTETQ